MLYPAELRSHPAGIGTRRRLYQFTWLGGNDRKRKRQDRNAVLDQRPRLLRSRLTMDRHASPSRQGASPARCRRSDRQPSRIAEQLGLQRRQLGDHLLDARASSCFGRESRGAIGALATSLDPQKGHCTRPLLELLLKVSGGSKPGFEPVAPGAVKIEDDHRTTSASAIGRRCASAGMRCALRRSRLSSMSTKPTPVASPMSSSTSPQGLDHQRMAVSSRPSSWCPDCAAATMKVPASIARARSSTSQCARPVGTVNAAGTAIRSGLRPRQAARTRSGKRRS